MFKQFNLIEKTRLNFNFFEINKGCYCGVSNEVMCGLSLVVLKKK